jgi:hypothetical protein
VREEIGDGLTAGDDAELGAAPRRSVSGRQRRVLAALGAVALAVLVGWQVLAILAKPAPAVPASSSRLPPAPARGTLYVTDVCADYGDSGPVEVSFRLVNETDRPLRVLTVDARLPLGMLHLDSAALRPGTCGPAELRSAAPDRDLRPGESTPVTFLLSPTVPCPQPAPVQADVRTIEEDFVIDHILLVLPDLSSLKVPGCS